MVKVMHVIWSATIGGIERVVMDLITEQMKNPDLQVSLLIGKSEGDLLSRFQALSIPCHAAGLKSGTDLSFSAYRHIQKLFLATDIIHIHSYNPIISFAASNSGKRIIYTEHGNFGFGKKKKSLDIIVNLLRKRFLNNSVDTILFNSRFTQSIALSRYGLSKVKQKIVYNGIPMQEKENRLPPDDLKNLTDSYFTIGTVARMAGVKRIDRLLKVYALFSKSKTCRLVIIGDGPLMKKMQQLAVTLGIEGTTIFAGYRQDARECMQLMQVCALTSQQEAFGLFAVEAWEAGKPVIVFKDAGGLAELVKQLEVNDIAEDEEQFVKRLEYYYEHRDLLNDVQKKKARIDFANRFSIETMQKEIYSIYKG
jgi:glycosyltransferase involved in cell wall biosynthesis